MQENIDTPDGLAFLERLQKGAGYVQPTFNVGDRVIIDVGDGFSATVTGYKRVTGWRYSLLHVIFDDYKKECHIGRFKRVTLCGEKKDEPEK